MSIEDKILITSQKKLGLRIREIRKSKDLSQLDVASNCNYEKTTISRIENGRTNMTLKTLVTLSLALDIELKEFFNFEIDMLRERSIQ